MQLTQHTDYALRVLVYLALHPEVRVTTRDIAQAYGVSQNHLVKVIQTLVGLDLVDARPGRGGGLLLKRDPETINLGEAVAALEPHFHLVECFSPEGRCPIRPACRLKSLLAEAQHAFLDTLGRYHLDDVLTNPSTLLRLLGSS